MQYKVSPAGRATVEQACRGVVAIALINAYEVPHRLHHTLHPPLGPVASGMGREEVYTCIPTVHLSDDDPLLPCLFLCRTAVMTRTSRLACPLEQRRV